MGSNYPNSSMGIDSYRQVLAQQDQAGHAAGLAIPAVGEKALRVAVGTQVAAEDARHAQRSQAHSGQGVQVGEIVAGAARIGRETRSDRGLRQQSLPPPETPRALPVPPQRQPGRSRDPATPAPDPAWCSSPPQWLPTRPPASRASPHARRRPHRQRQNTAAPAGNPLSTPRRQHPGGDSTGHRRPDTARPAPLQPLRCHAPATARKQQPREAVRWPECPGFPPRRSRCLPHGAPG